MSETEQDHQVQEPDIAADPGPTQPSRWSSVLIAIATILAIITVFAVWSRTQLLDNDEWVNLSTEVLEHPDVQERVADYLVTSLYSGNDVTAGLEEVLPEDLEGLATPLAGFLQGPLTGSVERIISSDDFQQLWESANRIAHQTLVNILRDETRDPISTAGGAVTLDLRPMVVQLGERLGLSQDRLDQIPEDTGQFTILESGELDNLQQSVEILDFLAWFLFVLIAVLYAAALYLGRARMMATLRHMGWSLVFVGLVVVAVQAIAARVLLDQAIDNPANEDAAREVAVVATSLVRQMGWSSVIYGVLIVGFTSLMGAGRRSEAVRRALAPAFNASGGIVAGGTVVGILLLLWWSPGRAFDRWTTGLVLIGLVIGAVVMLRDRTKREFPDIGSEPDDVLDVRDVPEPSMSEQDARARRG